MSQNPYDPYGQNQPDPNATPGTSYGSPPVPPGQSQGSSPNYGPYTPNPPPPDQNPNYSPYNPYRRPFQNGGKLNAWLEEALPMIISTAS